MRLPSLSTLYRESLPEPRPFSVCATHPFWPPSVSMLARSGQYRIYSSVTADVATKTVASWSNALDSPSEDQCGLFDVGALTYDQRGPLDAPNVDSQCAPNEPVVASPEAFELTDTFRSITHATLVLTRSRTTPYSSHTHMPNNS